LHHPTGGYVGGMSWTERFNAAMLQAFRGRTTAPELLPMVLSQAAVQVLPVDGVGISMTDELRVPLGASDPMVARAERLQTTLGEGPCLSAAADGEPVIADLATMAASWPLFCRELTEQTPYRSVAALPLRLDGGRVLGALDLYSTGSDALPQELVEDVSLELAEPITAMVFGSSAVDADRFTPPLWLAADSVIDRMNVWVAVGLVLEKARLDNAGALAVLRAYAFDRAASLDDVAADLTSGKLRPESLLN